MSFVVKNCVTHYDNEKLIYKHILLKETIHTFTPYVSIRNLNLFQKITPKDDFIHFFYINTIHTINYSDNIYKERINYRDELFKQGKIGLFFEKGIYSFNDLFKIKIDSDLIVLFTLTPTSSIYKNDTTIINFHKQNIIKMNGQQEPCENKLKLE